MHYLWGSFYFCRLLGLIGFDINRSRVGVLLFRYGNRTIRGKGISIMESSRHLEHDPNIRIPDDTELAPELRPQLEEAAIFSACAADTPLTVRQTALRLGEALPFANRYPTETLSGFLAGMVEDGLLDYRHRWNRLMPTQEGLKRALKDEQYATATAGCISYIRERLAEADRSRLLEQGIIIGEAEPSNGAYLVTRASSHGLRTIHEIDLTALEARRVPYGDPHCGEIKEVRRRYEVRGEHDPHRLIELIELGYAPDNPLPQERRRAGYHVPRISEVIERPLTRVGRLRQIMSELHEVVPLVEDTVEV